MPYQVTFKTGRKVNVYNAEFMNSEQVRQEANKLHGDRDYRYDPKLGRARWVDIEVPVITKIERMDEVYINGGYCLVPANC